MEAVHTVYSRGEHTITVAATLSERATSPQSIIIYYSTHNLQKKFTHGAGTMLPLLPVQRAGGMHDNTPQRRASVPGPQFILRGAKRLFDAQALYAQLVITDDCNLSCGYCNEYMPGAAPIPLPILQARVDKLAALGVFVTGIEAVPFDPGSNRIFIRFTEGGNILRGSTSVAVRTQ